MTNASSGSVTNPRLIQAMQALLKNDNVHTRSMLASALMDAKLLSPI